MGGWISTSILMGGWVSTSITMGEWYPGWYTPTEEKSSDNNNITSLHILDCPLCLGNMKLRIVKCKTKQNVLCKTCRPNIGLCPYWQETIRLKMKCKDADTNNKKLPLSNKNASSTNVKATDGPDSNQGKNRHFRIYKCGLAM